MSTLISGIAAALLAAATLVAAPSAHATPQPTCQGEEATIVGTPGRDRLVGTSGPDVIVALGGNDLVIAGAGDDLVCGGGGADELRSEDENGDGPADDDTLVGGHGDDSLVSLAGRDILHGDAGGDDVVSLGGRPSEVYGGAGDDRVTLIFSRRPGFVLDGGDGDDSGQIWGPRRVAGGGRPTAALVLVADGLVVASEVGWGTLGGLERLLLGANMRWGYRGTDAPEVLHSTGIWLRARMGGGDDVVRGTPGPDRIHAGDGTDRVSGANGHDRCWDAESVRRCEVVSP